MPVQCTVLIFEYLPELADKDPIELPFFMFMDVKSAPLEMPSDVS
jgi:hypothetical protein